MIKLTKIAAALAAATMVLMTAGCSNEDFSLKQLDSPDDVTVVLKSSSSVSLSWRGVDHATSYRIYARRTDVDDAAKVYQKTVSIYGYDSDVDSEGIIYSGLSGLEGTYVFYVEATNGVAYSSLAASEEIEVSSSAYRRYLASISSSVSSGSSSGSSGGGGSGTVVGSWILKALAGLSNEANCIFYDDGNVWIGGITYTYDGTTLGNIYNDNQEMTGSYELTGDSLTVTISGLSNPYVRL